MFLLELFGNNKSYVAMGVIILCLCVSTLWYKLQVSECEQKIISLQVSLTNAQGTIDELNKASVLDKNQLENFNTLLGECYKSIFTTSQELQQVDDLMSQSSSTPLHSTEVVMEDGTTQIKEGVSYEQITKEQNTAGINFINSQF